MRFKGKKWLAVASGVVLVLGVAAAFGAPGDWWPFDEDSTIEVSHNLGNGGPGPETTLKVHRGALQAGGTFSMQFHLRIAAVGILTSAELQTAMDSNNNTILDEAEWATIATATIKQSGGVTHATTPTVMVLNTLDGYRVRYVRTDVGTTWESWVNTPGKHLTDE